MCIRDSFKRERIVVTCQNQIYNQAVLIHELAHRFNNHYLAFTSPWLNEGLASYFEGVHLSNGQLTISKLPIRVASKWKKSSFLPKISELFEFNYEEFKAEGLGGYAAAWKLIHLLNNHSEDHHRRFKSYLAALMNGTTRDKAWQDAWGDIPLAKLEDEFKRYHHKRKFVFFTVPYAKKENTVQPVIRKIPGGEAHSVWLQLLMFQISRQGSEEGFKDAYRQLDLMNEEYPNWKGNILWRAVVDHYLEEEKTSESLLRKYASRYPKDSIGWLSIVKVAIHHIENDGYIGFGAIPDELKKLEDDVDRLIPLAQSAEELHAIAKFYALMQDAKTGLSYVDRALELRKGNHGYLETRALLLFHEGSPKEAYSTQMRALEVFSGRTVPSKLQERLEHYKKAAEI